MGIVSSKDETGAVVATSLRGQDILDYEGRDLRDKMDVCLSKYMWYWTLGGVVLSVPLSFYLKSQKPFFAAALICPIGDMMYATNKCYPEKEAFAAHYKMLQEKRALAIQRALHGDEQELVPASSSSWPNIQQQAEAPASAQQQEEVIVDALQQVPVAGTQQQSEQQQKRKGWW